MQVSNLTELREMLQLCPPTAFAVRGAPVDEGATTIPYRQSRTKPGAPPTLKAASSKILPIDVDSKDGPLSALPGDDLERCARAARDALPAEFRHAACIAQATSSAGVEPGARVRLWFMCDRPVSDRTAKTWLAHAPVDRSIYTPAQPIYVAPPTFQGVPDPYAGRSRCITLDGGHVIVPNLQEREIPQVQHGPVRAVAPEDSQLTDGLLLSWERDCATRSTQPGGSHRAWYNNEIFALGTRAYMCPEINWEARIVEGIKTWKNRQTLDERLADSVSLETLTERALEALRDGQAQPWIPTEDVPPGAPSNAPEKDYRPNTEAAEKALKKAAKRVKEGLMSVDAAVDAVAKHVAVGALEASAVGIVLSDRARDLATGESLFISPADIAAKAEAKATELRETQGAALYYNMPTVSAQIAARMILSDDGKPLACPENLRILLAENPEIRLWFNTRSQTDYWEVCPWKSPGPVTTHDDADLRCYVSKALSWHKCPMDPLAAIGASARHRPYDPWRAWLEGLVWDGRRRLGRAPVHLLGCAPTPINRLMFTWWMISAVARSLEPGCQVDYVLVLEGEQGERKTTFLRELAMDPQFFTRFAHTGGDLHSARPIGKITGPVIVELAELAALASREVESVKAFVDERRDRVQWLYSKKPVDVPRSCVFAATTNSEEYLRDVTGNRRFWPIKCGTINIDLLKHHRVQLWAEAVMLYKRGVAWWPRTRHLAERVGLVEAQAQRQVVSAAAEPLAEKLAAAKFVPGTNPLTGETWMPEQLDSQGRPLRFTISQAAAMLGLHPVRDRGVIVAGLRALGYRQEGRSKGKPAQWSLPGAPVGVKIDTPREKISN